MTDSYLPPVIANLLADVSDFVTNWQAAAQAAQESAAEIAAAREVASGGPDGAGGGSSEAALASASQEAAAAQQQLAAASGDAAAAEEAEAGAADTAAGNTAQLGQDADDTAGSLGGLASAADEAATASSELTTEADDAATAVTEAGAAAADAAGDLAGFAVAADAAAASSTQFGGGALIVGSALDEVAQGLVSMRPGFDEYGRALNESSAGMRSMIGQAGESQTSLGGLRRSFEETAPAGRALGSSASEAGRGMAEAGSEASRSAAEVGRSGQAARGAETGWVGLFDLMTHGPDIIDGVTAAVGVAVPVITGMAVGLAAFATGAGVAALGLNGLEQAAQQMDAALEPLKEAADQAFEKTLLPAVNDVMKAAPQMRTEVTDTATAIGGMLKSLIDVGTSSQGIQDLNKWLAGTADFFNEGKRGAEQFGESVLTFLASAAPAMQQFGADFADVEADWNKLIQTASQSGEIAKSVEGAGEAFKGFMELIARVVDAMMKLSADVGPQVGEMFKNIGSAVEAIEPPLSMFIKGFTMGIDVVAKLVTAAEGIAEPFSVISGLLAAMAIGFKVFEWVIAPINQTIRLIRLLGTAITDTSGLSILWAKFTDAIGLTEGAAKRAQMANAGAAESMTAEGAAAEGAATKNGAFTESLTAKGVAAEAAAEKMALMTDALRLEGAAAEGAAAKNTAMAASTAEAGLGAEAAGAGFAGAGTAGAAAAADVGAIAPAAEEAGAGLAAAGGAEGAGALVAGISLVQPEVGLAILAVGALVAGGYALAHAWSSSSDSVEQSTQQQTGAIEQGSAQQVGAVQQGAQQQVQATQKGLDQQTQEIQRGVKAWVPAFQGTQSDVTNAVVTLWQNLTQISGQQGNKTAGEFASSAKAATAGFAQPLTGGNGVGAANGGLIKVVEDFWSSIVNDSHMGNQKLAGEFAGAGKDASDGMTQGIQKGKDTTEQAVSAWISDMVGTVKSLLGIQSPSTAFADIGKDIVDGLTLGLVRNFQSVVHALEGLIPQLIAAVKNQLGIQSPSVEFHSIGQFMMEGWRDGIIAGAGKVTDAVRQVSQDALSAGRSGLAAGAAGAAVGALPGGSIGASGPIQVLLHVEGNDSAMAAQIQSMFRKGQIKISANNVVRGRAYS